MSIEKIRFIIKRKKAQAKLIFWQWLEDRCASVFGRHGDITKYCWRKADLAADIVYETWIEMNKNRLPANIDG